jgi:RNA polymerase sigma-70 factor (ECF subfamily)
MNQDSREPANSKFASTHWSIVLAAGHRSSAESGKALAELCRTYWFPLYAYARRHTRHVHEAQDLTQGFFAFLLEKDSLAGVLPERGRFRAFLLTAFRHYMVNEWNKARTQKRGGGVPPISLDFVRGEERYSLEPADRLTPERLYERQWALSLLDHVLKRLHDEFTGAGKAWQFALLKVFITPQAAGVTQAEAARQLGMTEGAVAVAVHRLRRRYAEILRAEIEETVADAADVDDEIRDLFAALES